MERPRANDESHIKAQKCGDQCDDEQKQCPEVGPDGTDEGSGKDLAGTAVEDTCDVAQDQMIDDQSSEQAGFEPLPSSDIATTSALTQRMQKYTCKRMRRKALLAWVTGKVQEISREDADEPDDEETEIRTALMEAIGIASVNVENDLGEMDLEDLFAPTPMVRQRFPKDPKNHLPGSGIRFADNAVTYLLKLEEAESAAPELGQGPQWKLDGVVEMGVFVDGPSAPLQKWSTH